MEPSPPGFSLNNFDIHWETLDDDAKAHLIDQADSLEPQLGILPVIQGLKSFHFKVRTSAKKKLVAIQNILQAQLNHPKDKETHETGLAVSAMVSARICQQIRPELPASEMEFFLKTLLSLGDKGAYFAFKAIYLGNIPLDTLKKLIPSLDQAQRLLMTDPYLKAGPGVRVKLGSLFKEILKTINRREKVVEFYAGLFDRNQDADPFLNNIRFEFRNPDLILEQEMASPSPAIKIMGLKALSMMRSKIPFHLLVKLLDNQEEKTLRQAVYSLVERSSMGVYPELFEPIFTHFHQRDQEEAVLAFKALVVTGKMPVHDLFRMIRKTRPQVLPEILDEISSLSRISFFVIQDLAMNKEKYLGDNLEVNLACVLGMIQKRPERVVKTLHYYYNQAKDPSVGAMDRDVADFMEKTRNLLVKEKDHIEALFFRMKALLTDRVEPPKNIFISLFHDPIKKKIQAIKKNIPMGSVDLQGINFKNESLSTRNFSASRLFFNQAGFESCDLSNASFIKACFNGAIFYNVSMDNTVFDTIPFDNAVFINVSAQGAIFKNCSFQGACLVNCNFSRADLTGAVFINAQVTKTAFDGTDLSCACFAHAKLSGVSFVTAHVNLADFSGVQARFTRFPSYAHTLMMTQGINYNHRQYQLSFKDLPPLDSGLVSEINRLIFCEFIHYGEIKFLDQNKLSLLTAYDIFKPAQADLFSIIPLILHENFEFSSLKPVPENTPCGLADFLPTQEAVNICEKYGIKHQFKIQRKLNPRIQGLFTMGSVGSLAQTIDSDIDYWVCINEEAMESKALELLRKKIGLIEHLARERFKTRVTFFLVDILKARNNDFGDSTLESSGTAQSRLLKEEFYRTMIHVAGKLPLWAVLPTAISLNYYHMILDQVSRFAKSHRYMDLGDIHAIPVNEYFGASIWQMFKWLESPFKSVIKMALLEKYIHSYGKEPLLCNQYKNEWMNAGTHLKLARNDSYIILLRNLIPYYQQGKDNPSANLILTCFFMKLEISKQGDLGNTLLGLRNILVDECLETWQWDHNKLFEVGRYRKWNYARIHRLSATIEQFMLTKYARIKKYFDIMSRDGLMISSQDRSVLERKVDIVFLEKPFKIKKMLLVPRGDRLFSKLYLKHLPGGTWELIHKESGLDHEETLMKADTIEQIGAWLILNTLYTEHLLINLIPNPTRVSHDDIQKLFKAMHDFFVPDIERSVRFHELHKPRPAIVSIFISINFYAARQQTPVNDCSAIYMNSWGEMYARSIGTGKGFSSLETAQKELLSSLGISKLPEKTVFYFSKGMARQ